MSIPYPQQLRGIPQLPCSLCRRGIRRHPRDLLRGMWLSKLAGNARDEQLVKERL